MTGQGGNGESCTEGNTGGPFSKKQQDQVKDSLQRDKCFKEVRKRPSLGGDI